VNYSNRINGFDSINLTKLDVLTGIKKLQVVTHYTLDGRKLDGQMPATVEELGRCKTVSVELDGWDEDITKVKSYEELPRNAQDYVTFIE